MHGMVLALWILIVTYIQVILAVQSSTKTPVVFTAKTGKSGSSGEIRSPNFPRPYSLVNTTYVFRLRSKDPGLVQLRFSDFVLHKHSVLKIYDGPDSKANSSVWTRESLPPVFESRTRTVLVVFKVKVADNDTDDINPTDSHYVGFKAQYSFIHVQASWKEKTQELPSTGKCGSITMLDGEDGSVGYSHTESYYAEPNKPVLLDCIWSIISDRPIILAAQILGPSLTWVLEGNLTFRDGGTSLGRSLRQQTTIGDASQSSQNLFIFHSSSIYIRLSARLLTGQALIFSYAHTEKAAIDVHTRTKHWQSTGGQCPYKTCDNNQCALYWQPCSSFLADGSCDNARDRADTKLCYSGSLRQCYSDSLDSCDDWSDCADNSDEQNCKPSNTYKLLTRRPKPKPTTAYTTTLEPGQRKSESEPSKYAILGWVFLAVGTLVALIIIGCVWNHYKCHPLSCLASHCKDNCLCEAWDSCCLAVSGSACGPDECDVCCAEWGLVNCGTCLCDPICGCCGVLYQCCIGKPKTRSYATQEWPNNVEPSQTQNEEIQNQRNVLLENRTPSAFVTASPYRPHRPIFNPAARDSNSSSTLPPQRGIRPQQNQRNVTSQNPVRSGTRTPHSTTASATTSPLLQDTHPSRSTTNSPLLQEVRDARLRYFDRASVNRAAESPHPPTSTVTAASSRSPDITSTRPTAPVSTGHITRSSARAPAPRSSEPVYLPPPSYNEVTTEERLPSYNQVAPVNIPNCDSEEGLPSYAEAVVLDPGSAQLTHSPQDIPPPTYDSVASGQ